MALPLRRPGSLTLAFCLVAAPCRVLAAADPGPCPGVKSGDSDEIQLRRCVEAARTAEPNHRASLSQAALALARRLYHTGRKDLDPRWLEGRGDLFVHYGTEGCETALTLEPSTAAAMLDTCIELLGAHFLDLGQAGLTRSTAAEETAKRRTALQDLRNGLTQSQARPTVQEPEFGDESPGQPSPAETKSDSPPRSSRGLLAGLGVSGGLTVLSAIALGVSWSSGQRAHERIRPTQPVYPADLGKSLCELEPPPAACDDHLRARRLFVASAVALSVSALATVVFTGLVVRHKRRATESNATVFAAPVRTGWLGGVSVRF